MIWNLSCIDNYRQKNVVSNLYNVFVRKKYHQEVSMEKLNVGIADDNELIVSLLSDIVAQDEELRVVGTARN